MSSSYKLKTRPTGKDPLRVISEIPDAKKQADAKFLLALFEKCTGEPPVVWGEKFIGYGIYRYRCASGYTGEIYATGFSVTKRRITLHLSLEGPQVQDCLRRLGKTASGKSCVYVNKLADIDTAVLEELIAGAYRLANGPPDGGG